MDGNDKQVPQLLYIDRWTVYMTGTVTVDAKTEALVARLQRELVEAVQHINARIPTMPENDDFPGAKIMIWVEQ